MRADRSPEALVQRQLDAYNAKDLESWLATYAADAQQFEHPGKLLASGHAELRTRGASRFADPLLHATLLRRLIVGNLVIDEEQVRMTLPEGPGSMGLICLYVVTDGLIQSVSFIYGTRTLDRKP